MFHLISIFIMFKCSKTISFFSTDHVPELNKLLFKFFIFKLFLIICYYGELWDESLIILINVFFSFCWIFPPQLEGLNISPGFDVSSCCFLNRLYMQLSHPQHSQHRMFSFYSFFSLRDGSGAGTNRVCQIRLHLFCYRQDAYSPVGLYSICIVCVWAVSPRPVPMYQRWLFI